MVVYFDFFDMLRQNFLVAFGSRHTGEEVFFSAKWTKICIKIKKNKVFSKWVKLLIQKNDFDQEGFSVERIFLAITKKHVIIVNSRNWGFNHSPAKKIDRKRG
ncbi:hypothetical protein AV540_06335 [Brevibacillus parabrevis]|nr:hypothetical protein AV540_06335 [Brevibacillus parabrevis]